MSVLSRRQLLQRGAAIAAGAIAASNFAAGAGEASDAKAPETPDNASAHAPFAPARALRARPFRQQLRSHGPVRNAPVSGGSQALGL